MPSAVVGRTMELATLRELLTPAHTGTGVVAFIEAEAGLGKTALLYEVIGEAEGFGFVVFVARAEELEQDRPFHAIADALGDRTGTDERRIELARLLSEASDETGAFFRIVDAVEDLVEAESLKRPVLLAVDDLQWADAGTIRALGAVCRRASSLPVAVVGAMRPTPRSEDLGSLLRSTPGTWIQLRPLDDDAVAELASSRLGISPGPRLRTHLAGAGGNPFYLLELLDALRADIHVDGSQAEIDSWTLPPSLVLVVLQRLSGLPDGVLAILRAAAVLGSSFHVPELATAAQVSADNALDAVIRLRAEGILTDSEDRVAFRHDLIREAVYEDLGEPVRVRMHGRIARDLISAGAAPRDVSGHLMRGATPGDTEVARLLLEAAFDMTQDAHTSVQLAERALEIHPTHPRRPWIAVEMERLLLYQGRPAEAIPVLEEALAFALDSVGRLRVLEGLISATEGSGRWEAQAVWMRQAAALVTTTPLADDRAHMLCVGQVHAVLGSVDEAMSVTEDALALASGPALVGACNQMAWVLLIASRPAEAIGFAERTLALPGPRWARSAYRCHLAWALEDVDRAAEAEPVLIEACRMAEEDGMLASLARSLTGLAHLRFATARLDQAEIDAQTALDVLKDSGPTIDSATPTQILAWISFHRGEDADPSVCALDLPGQWSALGAVLACVRGEIDEAGRLARKLLDGLAPRYRHRRWYDVLPVVARIALDAADPDTASRARDRAVALASRTDAPGVVLAAARCRALVEQDPAAAEEVVSLARTSPRLMLAAGALEDAARVLGDPDLRSEAAGIYHHAGARRDAARLGLAVPSTPTRSRPAIGWETLTPAEIQVVRLAAEGLTNREIGSRLFISHRTVGSHLSHIYDKVGIRSRVALARESVARLGTLPEASISAEEPSS